MAKLSSYTLLTQIPITYMVPVFQSGTQNYRASYLDFGSGLLPYQGSQSGRVLATNGASGLSWISVAAGSFVALSGSESISGVKTFASAPIFNTIGTNQVYYDTTLKGSNNLLFDGTTLSGNTLVLTNALGLAYGGTASTTASGAINTLVPSQAAHAGKVLGTNGGEVSWVATGTGSTTPGGNSANIQYNNAGAFAGTDNFVWNNANTRLEIKNLQPSSIVFMSGSSIQTHANFILNSGTSALTANGSITINSGLTVNSYSFGQSYGWSFNSGIVSGSFTNGSYEIPIIKTCILQSGGYSQILSKTNTSGDTSGLVVNINYSGSNVSSLTSIWSGASGLRLTMPNNTRSGSQENFAYSGLLLRGGYISIDFVTYPTGQYANDIIVELLTMAQN